MYLIYTFKHPYIHLIYIASNLPVPHIYFQTPIHPSSIYCLLFKCTSYILSNTHTSIFYILSLIYLYHHLPVRSVFLDHSLLQKHSQFLDLIQSHPVHLIYPVPLIHPPSPLLLPQLSTPTHNPPIRPPLYALSHHSHLRNSNPHSHVFYINSVYVACNFVYM